MKVENNNNLYDEPPSSTRSRKAPSLASSRKGLQIRKLGGHKDSDTKSKMDTMSHVDKKEN